MQCRSCKTSNLSSFQMKKEKGIVTRGICLPCASEASKLQKMRSRVELSPSDYMECNDCDSYFKKNNRGRFYSIRVKCPYCYSKNISGVV